MADSVASSADMVERLVLKSPLAAFAVNAGDQSKQPDSNATRTWTDETKVGPHALILVHASVGAACQRHAPTHVHGHCM
jgi:hypothetical protein